MAWFSQNGQMDDWGDTNHRGVPLNSCNGHGGWFEVSDVFPNEHTQLLGVRVNNVDWDHWKASFAFYLTDADGPVNFFHLSTDPAPTRPWRAGLEVGLRQGRLTACLNHGTMAQENLSRYEEVSSGPALTDGRRHEVNVWKHGEWLGLQVEDDGPVSYWRLPPHQWHTIISAHLMSTIIIGGRADHGDFKFPGHIESFLFQMGGCTQGPTDGMDPTCRMTCQKDPGRVTFALYQDPDNILGLGVVGVIANNCITDALRSSGLPSSPADFIGKRVTSIAGATSLTFRQIRRMITSLFPMMTGPLWVDAIGDGIQNNVEDLVKIDTKVPLGKGTVLAFVRRYLNQDTLLVVPPSNTGSASVAPLILMSMKIHRPPCSYVAQASE